MVQQIACPCCFFFLNTHAHTTPSEMLPKTCGWASAYYWKILCWIGWELRHWDPTWLYVDRKPSSRKSLPCLIFRRRERLQFCCTTPFASSGTVKGCSWMLGTWHLAEAQHSDMSMPATSIALQTHCGTSPFGNCISWFMQSDTYCIWMKEHNRTDSNFSFWIWQGARQLVIWPIISIIKMQA